MSDQTNETVSEGLDLFVQHYLRVEKLELKCQCGICPINRVSAYVSTDKMGAAFGEVSFSDWEEYKREQLFYGLCPCGLSHSYRLELDANSEPTLLLVDVGDGPHCNPTDLF